MEERNHTKKQYKHPNGAIPIKKVFLCHCKIVQVEFQNIPCLTVALLVGVPTLFVKARSFRCQFHKKLQAAFTHAGPKGAKKVKSSSFFGFRDLHV